MLARIKKKKIFPIEKAISLCFKAKAKSHLEKVFEIEASIKLLTAIEGEIVEKAEEESEIVIASMFAKPAKKDIK